MSVDAARGRLRLMRAYDAAVVSAETAIDTGTLSPVQQHLKDEVDINTIVKRFGITHQVPAGVPGGIFGDFTDVSDYESAVAKIERAQEGFLTLPADVRERFGNDPGKLVGFARNVPEEMLNAELGLAARGAAEAPVAPVVPPVGGTV